MPVYEVPFCGVVDRKPGFFRKLATSGRCLEFHSLDVLQMTEGYAPGPEWLRGENGEADVHLAWRVLDIKSPETPFLIVILKPAGSETYWGAWDWAVDQINKYFKSIGPEDKGYGAVATGKGVRFYEWYNEAVSDFEDDGTNYYLDRQCETVVKKLQYFKDNQ